MLAKVLGYEDLLLLIASDGFAVKLLSFTLVVLSILFSAKASVLLLTVGDSGNGTCEASISAVGDTIGDDSVTDIEGTGE
jgi:hypothetical protein